MNMRQDYNKPAMQIVRIDVMNPILDASFHGLPSQTALPQFNGTDTELDDEEEI